MELTGKIALVTGASSGIGAATARALAARGATVLIHYHRNTLGAEATLKALGGTGAIYQADLMEPEQVATLFAAIAKDHPTLDILINCAGDARSGKHFDSRLWEYEYKNILLSAVYATEHFLALSNENLRKIINITSIYGNLKTANAEHMQYSAMKAALANVTMSLAKAYAPRVLVNAVAPGYTATPAWEGTPTDRLTEIAGATRIGRLLTPEEIAQAVVAVVENDAMTGQVITIDGGTSLLEMP